MAPKPQDAAPNNMRGPGHRRHLNSQSLCEYSVPWAPPLAVCAGFDYAEVVRAALAEIELRLSRDELGWRLAASRIELAWLLGDARSAAHEEALR